MDEALIKASQPLADYLKKNHNPMTIAIVSEDRVDILIKENGTHFEKENTISSN